MVVYSFGECTLDGERYELRRGGELIAVEPQVFAVLLFLVENSNRVVTRDELLDAVWGDRNVSESTLSHRLMLARKAVGDSGREQKLIKTVHGRGYRFVAALGGTVVDSLGSGARQALLRQLQGFYQVACQGTRQVVFVTGEAGLGKTTLIKAFTAGCSGLVGRGHCLDHRGAGEPFLPVLEALGRLARGTRGRHLAQVLAAVAPTWLEQMPGLLSPQEKESDGRRLTGTTRPRMLREFAEAVELLTQTEPLVLVLEELHWSDPSTLDLFDLLARREDPARLMILASWRPEGPILDLAGELVIKGHAVEMALPPLEFSEVEMLAAESLGGLPAKELTQLLLERCGGNPLFLNCLLEHCLSEGLLEKTDDCSVGLARLASEIPENLIQMIERQLVTLPCRELLEAASVAGTEFLAESVAAALEMDADKVEEVLGNARVAVSAGCREWPDGSLCEAYRFRHELYRQVLYEKMPVGRRRRMHQRIGRRLATAFGARSKECAGEMALHFTRGGLPKEAGTFCRLAGEQALRRNAHSEALSHLQTGLEQIRRLSPGAERDRMELDLLNSLSPAWVFSRGWSCKQAEASLQRARELAQELDDSAGLSLVLFRQATLYEVRGQYQKAQGLLEERLDFSTCATSRVESEELLACSTFHQGLFEDCLRHCEEGLACYEPEAHWGLTAHFGENPAVACHSWAALALCFLGHHEQARERSQLALALARESALSFSLSNGLTQAAALHQHQGDPDKVLEYAQAAIDAGIRSGFAQMVAVATVLMGWARREPEQIQNGLEQYARCGAEMDRPYFLGLLAEIQLLMGLHDLGLEAVEEALELVRQSRRYFYEPELHRLRGELLAPLSPQESERCLRQALEGAHRLKSPVFARRASASLSR